MEKKATGYDSSGVPCLTTAPNATLLASVSRTKGNAGSGLRNTVAEHIASFMALNAVNNSGEISNVVWEVTPYSGADKTAK